MQKTSTHMMKSTVFMSADQVDQASPTDPHQRSRVTQFKQACIDPSVRYEPAHAQQASQSGTQEGDEHPIS